MAYDIGVIPGDGIGKEVVEATLPVLGHAAEQTGTDIESTVYDWGSERYLETGRMMPEDGLTDLDRHDAILLGAVGHPDVPDHVTLPGLRLRITKGFRQHVCKRPAYLFEGVESPLRGYTAGNIDLVVFRQNTEGEYADVGGREHEGTDAEVAVQSAVFTRAGTEPLLRAAFDGAMRRDRKLTNVTKSNAQAYGMVFWDDLVAEIAADYPAVEVERLLVDAASMDFVRRPDEFDVVVASNLFGDILTDLGAIITGSMGLAPSSNINPSGTFPSMFEPVHGSAFDIAGDGIANPLATVLSGELLFEHLGDGELATRLRTAVADQLADPDAPRPPDLGGQDGTTDVTTDLIDRI